jgi:ribonuclease BN (tRNA processing enzyme)
MDIKLQFIGSGGGLGSPKENFHSNAVLIKTDSTGQRHLFGIDCGSTFQLAIEDLGFDVNEFDGFYVTHLHADHVNGFEWVGFKRYFGTYPFGQNRPLLFGNTEVLETLWKNVLSGGMESIQGQRNSLETYFKPKYVPPNGKFCWTVNDANGKYKTEFYLVQTVHVVDDRRIKPSFGMMFDVNGKRIFYTGDTQFAPNQIMTYYEQSDVIFQDCELADYPNSVHAQYRQLITLPEDIRNKMWLYHYNGNIPDASIDGFLGFVKKGQIFEF